MKKFAPRRVAIGLSIFVLIAPSPAEAAGDITFQCTETFYDQTGNHPYDVPQYFVLRRGMGAASLRWDNRDVELPVTKNSTTILEADGRAKEYMPVPEQIDKCIAAELTTRPELRYADGTVNHFTVKSCETGADRSATTVPISVQIKIDRLTGSLTVTRRQDDNPNHDTEQHGTCKTTKPQF